MSHHLCKDILYFMNLLEEKEKNATGGKALDSDKRSGENTEGAEQQWWQSLEKAGKEEKEGITGLDERNQGEQKIPSPCTAFMCV